MSDATSQFDASDQPSSQALVEQSTAVLAHHSKSFRLASLFLPRQRRQDAALLYALCRLIDDLADEADDREQAAGDLDHLRAELVGRRRPRPLVAEFLKLAERRHLELDFALELIQGVESDLDDVIVGSDERLLRYCYRVAGTVGLMMCAVLGVTDPRGLAHAIDLGVAMQLTNICRDVLEDARMGRVYLPADRLGEVGVEPADLIAERATSEALAPVVEDLLDLADTYYASADRGMCFIPLRARLAIVVASRVYRAIGVHLRWRGTKVMAGRTVVSPLAKLVWVMIAFFSWLRLSLGGSPPADHQHQHRLHRPLRGLPGVSRS